MKSTEWKDLIVEVEGTGKKEIYTQSDFEQVVGDRFIEMDLNEDQEPVMIQTRYYMCMVKKEKGERDLPVSMVRCL